MSSPSSAIVIDDDDGRRADYRYEVNVRLNLVSEALRAQGEKTVFAVGGDLPNNLPVKIRWDEVKRDEQGNVVGTEPHKCLAVTLPAIDSPTEAGTDASMIEELVKACQPAAFGRGSESVLDETYRKAGKMDRDNFAVDFNPYEHGIMDVIAKSLVHATHYGVRAELYKLNVYSSPSGMFKPHVDTPRSPHQMGSLVVCLPHPHKGGDLAVRHGGRQTIFNWAHGSKSTIQWAAFFSDCEHEVLPVTEGYRITVAYNLYWIPDGPASHHMVLDPETLDFYYSLKRLLACCSFLPNGGKIGYTCVHAYPHRARATNERSLTASLKGLDMMVFHALHRLTGNIPRVKDVAEDGNYQDWQEFRRDDSDSDEEMADELYTNGYPDRSAAGAAVGAAIGPVFLSTEWDRDRNDDVDLPPPEHDDFKGTFHRERVAWINCLPDEGHQELAIAYIACGNEPRISCYYSSAVITVEFTRDD